MSPVLRMNDDVGHFAVAATLQLRRVIEDDYVFSRSVSWPTSATTSELDSLPGLHYRGQHGHGGEEAFVVSADLEASAAVSVNDGHCQVRIGGHELAAVDELLRAIQEIVPREAPVPGEPRVPVTFWSLGPHGPTARTRKIEVPSWPAIHVNYGGAVRAALNGLLGSSFAPAAAGQLLLWHGEPGTGKTWALRALGWEWRRWCDLHYVTDPETFFGDRASYMLDVLLHDETELAQPADANGGAPAEPKPDPRAAAGRWRLLVLEDTGELLSADAKDRTGQGLSRLLNVVDGLIGQGLRVLVLVTTNEVLQRLHPAVARPGRCAARVEFRGLDDDEADHWLEQHGGSRSSSRQSWTIAELFASLETTVAAVSTPSHSGVGFST